MSPAERERDLLANLLKLELFRMQVRLYGPDTRRSHPISDEALWSCLRELRAAAPLDSFRIWLVGSRLDPCRNDSDADLVLAPKADSSLSDSTIEDALWYCREYPLYRADPTCIVDPCYRASGPHLDLAALLPDEVRATVKLFSPQLLHEVLAGRIREYRCFSRFSIEYVRRAGETNYYRKLPRGNFGGRLLPYLRPALEVI